MKTKTSQERVNRVNLFRDSQSLKRLSTEEVVQLLVRKVIFRKVNKLG